MRIQDSLVTDKQIALELFSENGKFRLPIQGKDYYFPTLEKVHEAFLNQDTYDTIKLTHEGKKSYLHLFMDEIEVFDTEKALRQRLSQDSQGMWAEIRNGQKHYYIQQRGWISTSYKEITEQECIKKLQHTSTMTKVLGIGLGILALLPGAVEFARHLPISTKEAAMGLIALNQKSPVLGAVCYSLLPSKVEAQAVGTEFQINTYTQSQQTAANVAPLNNGGFVVVWESFETTGNLEEIFSRSYGRNGTANGAEFRVNTYKTSDQQFPTVAPLNDGGFVISWQSSAQDGDSFGIYGQRYDSNGIAVGGEFQINTYTTSDQQYPTIAPLNDGGFVISWQSSGQDGDNWGIYGRRYDSSGTPISSEFQVNTNTTNSQSYPSIAPLNSGGFVISWESSGQDGDLYGIYAQRYDNSGVTVGSEFQVNTYIGSYQRYPRVAPLNDGGFIITWESNGQDGSGYGIFGQRYDSNGLAAGTEFQANSYTTSGQNYPSVASLNDGGFVIAWESSGQDGDSFGIYAQRYDSNGLAAGAEFQVNIYTTNDQSSSSVAPLNDGGFVVTWESYFQDGDGYGIYGQRYDARGIPIPLEISASTIVTPTLTPLATTPTQNTPTQFTTNMLGSSTVSSAAQDPNSRTSFSTQLTAKTTSSSEASKFISSTPTLASVENLVYEETYPIFVNDQTVGTFTVSGGTGLLDSGNSNVIYFEFDPSFEPEEGDVITLFYLPEEEVALWESIEIEGESYECLEAQGQVATNQGRSSYQMVFEDTECVAIAPTMLVTTLPLTLN